MISFLSVTAYAAIGIERDACFVVEARVSFGIFGDGEDLRVVPRIIVEGENATDAFDSESRAFRARATLITRWRRSIRAEWTRGARCLQCVGNPTIGTWLTFFCARERRNGRGACMVGWTRGARALAGGVCERSKLAQRALSGSTRDGKTPTFARAASHRTGNELSCAAIAICSQSTDARCLRNIRDRAVHTFGTDIAPSEGHGIRWTWFASIRSVTHSSFFLTRRAKSAKDCVVVSNTT
jgi:hypothetical protein